MKTKHTAKRAAKAADRKWAAIDAIMDHVRRTCDYAIDNLCTEDCQFEELEGMLGDLAFGRYGK